MKNDLAEIPPLSPSTLNGFLGCEYQAWMNLPAQLDRFKDQRKPPQMDFLQERGEEHEDNVLAKITAEYKDVVEIEREGKSVEERAAATAAAMAEGRKVIYQGCLASAGWRGYPDFLIRVGEPSGNWDWSYEVHDAKLARHPEPRHIYQLLFYTEELGRIQGVDPRRMHLIVGTGETESFDPADFRAYADRVRDAFVDRYRELAAGAEPAYPYPVSACAFCDWWHHCQTKRRDDDHLCLTANITHGQSLKLEEADINTVAELAKLDAAGSAVDLKSGTLEKLRAQARLQVQSRGLDTPLHELLRPEYALGLGRLPAPSEGDVFFDFEGEPNWGEDGLEYLFGSFTREEGDWKYIPIWANNHVEERAATEQWIDWITERLERYPDLHVFHFNSYEVVALKRLTQRYATREDELDDLLRRKVFVDLYPITKQAARIGIESYGLKALEDVYHFERSEEINAIGSLWRWQKFQETGEQSWLDEIAIYNEDDCKSTVELYDWLLARRPEAEDEFEIKLAELEPEPERELSEEAIAFQERLDALRERLLNGIPEDASEDTDEQRALRLVFSLVGHHRREANPGWWEYYNRLGLTLEELAYEDHEPLSGLELTENEAESAYWEFTYPEQDHKMRPGGRAIALPSGKEMTIEELDDQARRLTVKIGRKTEEDLPVAFIPGGPYYTTSQRASLFEFAEGIASGGLDQPGPAHDMLMRRPPRFSSEVPPTADGHIDVDGLLARVAALDASALVVQGPPGTGKTYLGSRVAVRLMAQGLKVGVMSNSHAAIDNFLLACDEAADEAEEGESFEFSGWHKKGKYESSRIRTVDKVRDSELAEDLHAGTAWHWSHEGSIDSVDVLFIDEAGQVALADALAVARAAKSTVLLGDPQQLPHVSQGAHLFGAGASVLEHMLDGEKTIATDRGVFLDESWRMHPDICQFVSKTMYDGRLTSEPRCAGQSLKSGGLSGTGIRMIPVEHAGNNNQSVDEAQQVAQEFEKLLADGEFVDRDGKKRKIGIEDILVVSPYNAQVRCLLEHLPDGARVGTVDKFQGQEALVVIFSMASSSGDEISRGLSFLLNSNRLNVAISRAQALAAVVCSPSLLTSRCNGIEEMKLVNLLCRVADEAE